MRFLTEFTRNIKLSYQLKVQRTKQKIRGYQQNILEKAGIYGKKISDYLDKRENVETTIQIVFMLFLLTQMSLITFVILHILYFLVVKLVDMRVNEYKSQGIKSLVPPSVIESLSNGTLYEFLVELWNFENLEKIAKFLFKPFFKRVSPQEVEQSLKELPRSAQEVIVTDGFINTLPKGIKNMMVQQPEIKQLTNGEELQENNNDVIKIQSNFHDNLDSPVLSDKRFQVLRTPKNLKKFNSEKEINIEKDFIKKKHFIDTQDQSDESIEKSNVQKVMKKNQGKSFKSDYDEDEDEDQENEQELGSTSSTDFKAQKKQDMNELYKVPSNHYDYDDKSLLQQASTIFNQNSSSVWSPYERINQNHGYADKYLQPLRSIYDNDVSLNPYWKHSQIERSKKQKEKMDKLQFEENKVLRMKNQQEYIQKQQENLSDAQKSSQENNLTLKQQSAQKQPEDISKRIANLCYNNQIKPSTSASGPFQQFQQFMGFFKNLAKLQKEGYFANLSYSTIMKIFILSASFLVVMTIKNKKYRKSLLNTLISFVYLVSFLIATGALGVFIVKYNNHKQYQLEKQKRKQQKNIKAKQQ